MTTPEETINDDALTFLDIEVEESTSVAEVINSVDELLAMTAGHQIVSASEIADKLLDLRILVSKLPTR